LSFTLYTITHFIPHNHGVELRQQLLALLYEIMRALVCLWQPMCATVAYLTLAAGKVTEGQLLLTFTGREAAALLILYERVHRTSVPTGY
jgi:hypothetical protein